VGCGHHKISDLWDVDTAKISLWLMPQVALTLLHFRTLAALRQQQPVGKPRGKGQQQQKKQEAARTMAAATALHPLVLLTPRA